MIARRSNVAIFSVPRRPFDMAGLAPGASRVTIWLKKNLSLVRRSRAALEYAPVRSPEA